MSEYALDNASCKCQNMHLITLIFLHITEKQNLDAYHIINTDSMINLSSNPSLLKLTLRDSTVGVVARTNVRERLAPVWGEVEDSAIQSVGNHTGLAGEKGINEGGGKAETISMKNIGKKVQNGSFGLGGVTSNIRGLTTKQSPNHCGFNKRKLYQRILA